MSEILKELAIFMAKHELTFVATEGPLNKIAISYYNGSGFEDIQFDEEINAEELLENLDN